MTDAPPPRPAYQSRIVADLVPVRPLHLPFRRTWVLVPVGLLLALSAPILNGPRGDLTTFAPLLTWGASGGQAVLGLWLLALGFREAVPGFNLSSRTLAAAAAVTVVAAVTITLFTNAASPTVVRPGSEWLYWWECVIWPAALGAPFMAVATLMAMRAFPTRPAIAGALCGASAGVLSDAGWRVSCWISEPSHVVGAHALALLTLTVAGALLAAVADRARWRGLRSGL